MKYHPKTLFFYLLWMCFDLVLFALLVTGAVQLYLDWPK